MRTHAHENFLVWLKSCHRLRLCLVKIHLLFLLVMSDSRALFLDVSLPVAVPVPLALHSLSAHQHSLRELQPCNPRHERLFGPMAEFNTPARNEPNDPNRI